MTIAIVLLLEVEVQGVGEEEEEEEVVRLLREVDVLQEEEVHLQHHHQDQIGEHVDEEEEDRKIVQFCNTVNEKKRNFSLSVLNSIVYKV